jgi:tetratricopeptide (TPR) repeat protein
MLGAIRIAGASSADEARALAEGRNISYIVLPSWDNALDDFARIGSNQFDHTFVAFLHRWLPPRWLRPVPYHLPKVAGFEGQSVAIFAVIDVLDNATALSHLAEYFVEMGQMPQAVGVAYTLEQSFPADLGAAVARALTARAAGESAAFEAALNDVQTLVSRGDDKNLAWDRRVSLAIALAEGKRVDLAREQVRQCLAAANEARFRSLTTESLYRLLVLRRAFGLELPDARLQALAQQLLPRELRDRI